MSENALAACPACGLPLPAYARFCARCGTPQPRPGPLPPAPRAAARGLVPTWVVVLFWTGSVLSLALAMLYATIAASPRLAELQADPKQLRSSALLVAAWAAALFGAQVVAAVGLSRRREWARVPATLACVGWALTCVGLPVAVLVLAGLWRRRP